MMTAAAAPPLTGAGAAVAQPIATPLTRAAIYLVVTLNADAASCDAVRAMCADFSGLVKTVGFRDQDSRFSCIAGFGSDVWDRLFPDAPRPAELHPFREFRAGARHAIATPGDLLFHIRAERMDMCFEMASLIMAKLGSAVAIADETQGFQYFDNRDLLGFVDGTENPVHAEAFEAVFIGDEDPYFADGSYVIVQKYLHDMDGWNALPTEAQERIIGRAKLSNADLDESIKPTSAHNALTVITDANGQEVKIVRANMPFGSPGQGEFGTYFIGYARSPATIEQMLENMFIGRPPGNYDRLLDFSRAVTGTLFFVPAVSLLEALSAGDIPTSADATPPSTVAPAPASSPLNNPARPSVRDGSLTIGSLKGIPQNE